MMAFGRGDDIGDFGASCEFERIVGIPTHACEDRGGCGLLGSWWRNVFCGSFVSGDGLGRIPGSESDEGNGCVPFGMCVGVADWRTH